MSADGLLNNTLVQMGVLFSLGAITASIFHRFKLPSLLGYIMIGVMFGPSVLNWITREEIAFLSELGIIFLMFLVGLELSFGKIKRLKWQAPLAGLLQLTLAGSVLTLILALLGLPMQLAFLLGSVLALSSTAIVLKRLEEQRETESLQGRIILAILIIQDMAIVPLMTLVASLSKPLAVEGEILSVLMPAILGISKALVVAVGTFALSVKLLPMIMDKLVRSNEKEIFLLSSIAIVFGAAWVANALGISYEAGALIAGISLSGSLFSHQMFADTRAYRDVFVMLFFTSMGLWVDVNYIAQHWPMVLGVTATIMLVKAFAAYGAVRLSGFHHQSALWSAFALFQVGEFAFVALTQLMKSASLVPVWAPYLESWSPLICNAIVLTMFVTPLVMQMAPNIIRQEAELRSEKQSSSGVGDEPPEVLIAGFGPVAKRLTHSLKQLEIPYCIIEMNANTVKTLQAMHEPCIYGDVAHSDILLSAGICDAGFLVLTFPDILAAESAIQHSKSLNPNVIILARARYSMDVPAFLALGADQVVCEEFEVGQNFIGQLLRIKDIPEAEIQDILQTTIHA